MHIRKARSTDWDACTKLDHSNVTDRAWRIQECEREGDITVTFQPIRLPREVVVRYPRQEKDLEAGWAHCDLFLIARSGKRVYGYVTARSLPGHGIARLQDLVVEREWRRRGVGTELLQRATAWARDKGLLRLIAEVQTTNYPAIAFCRSQGFAFWGYSDWYWRTQDIALFFGQTVR